MLCYLQGIVLFLLFFVFPSLLEEAGDPGMLHCFLAVQKPHILSLLKCGFFFLSLSFAHFNPAKSSKALNTSCRLLVACFISPPWIPVCKFTMKS